MLTHWVAKLFEEKSGWEVFLNPLHFKVLAMHPQPNFVKVNSSGELIGNRKGRGRAGKQVYLGPAHMGEWRLREAGFDLATYSDSGSPETVSFRLDRDIKDRRSGGQEPVDLEIAKATDSKVAETVHALGWDQFFDSAKAEYRRAKERQLKDRLVREELNLSQREQKAKAEADLAEARRLIEEMKEQVRTATAKAIEADSMAGAFVVGHLGAIEWALRAVAAGQPITHGHLRYLEPHDCRGGYRLAPCYRELLAKVVKAKELIKLAASIEAEKSDIPVAQIRLAPKIDWEAATAAVTRLASGQGQGDDEKKVNAAYQELALIGGGLDPQQQEFSDTFNTYWKVRAVGRKQDGPTKV
jgi:hypothetical protein